EHGALHGVEVVRGYGADAGYLVRRDRDAQAGGADQQGTINLAGGDLLRRLDRDVRVVGAVLAPGDADVGDLVDAGVVLQQLLQRALVAVSGVVRSGGDLPAHVCLLGGGASPLPNALRGRVCSWDGARRPLGAERPGRHGLSRPAARPAG